MASTTVLHLPSCFCKLQRGDNLISTFFRRTAISMYRQRIANILRHQDGLFIGLMLGTVAPFDISFSADLKRTAHLHNIQRIILQDLCQLPVMRRDLWALHKNTVDDHVMSKVRI